MPPTWSLLCLFPGVLPTAAEVIHLKLLHAPDSSFQRLPTFLTTLLVPFPHPYGISLHHAFPVSPVLPSAPTADQGTGSSDVPSFVCPVSTLVSHVSRR